MIDTHAHLTDKTLFPSREEILNDARGAGVKNIITLGWNLQSSCDCYKFAQEHNDIYFAAGIHPSDCEECDNQAIAQLFNLATHEKCIAIGEIGLDYHYGKDNKEQQKYAFLEQIKLADKLGLPFIVHSRDASNDVTQIIQNNKQFIKKGFLMHCYSESKEAALQYLNAGAYFAFGGAITFKNAKKEEIIASIPLDRILCETDCPYMAPVPLRGTVNRPSNVVYVYEKIASVYGITVQELQKATKENAARLFKKFIPS